MGKLNKSEIKYIQSLRERKVRQAEGVMVAEGDKIVAEALAKHADRIITVYGLPQFNEEHKGFLNHVHNVEIDEQELERISTLKQPQRSIALIKIVSSNLQQIPQSGWSVVLDDIQDPGNFGSIVRACDWFGITNIFSSPASADCYNPKVVQASMGSILRVEVTYMELDKIPASPVLPLVVADGNGTSLKDFSWPANGLLVIGNEGKGVSENLRQLASQSVAIPRIGQAESLNAAMATGILLSHLRRSN